MRDGWILNLACNRDALTRHGIASGVSVGPDKDRVAGNVLLKVSQNACVHNLSLLINRGFGISMTGLHQSEDGLIGI
ncbi:hypothetical protein [Pantoea sp. OXWO6B1]|uniref:hypothetical protein n=1 Tax=Pantoea sp. OXWO6B1 TaxID=1835724 RepID=UPI0007C86ADE|nr:hypothetical protein [Pantoea sp. OXWO6B1]OAE08176.1 hypothetical protein A6A26_11360 [Pantoea sp. OXWO6B1]